ncbi:uracil-DNA glycosylase family protein [Paraflavisolibacter sp. H34]|uniref:uracil-DNA glycosylase family protein n=1 Tax=Huijunlia imazamoxiresistens TaxID=3127457 RepID=UPI00301AEECA
MTWAENLYRYYSELEPPKELPNNIQWLFPQQDKAVLDVVRRFLDKYYNDSERRTLLLGINPGRFGAGITGVNFTASRQLEEVLQMDHPFKKGTELSAEFIYRVIEAYGGPGPFYQNFFIGSVCPLGFVQNGKNLNYYDDKELLRTIEPFLVQSISRLVSFGVDQRRCLVIGGAENFRYLSALNGRYRWFEHLEPLPHPRFVMQYKRKSLPAYVDLYLEKLSAAGDAS